MISPSFIDFMDFTASSPQISGINLIFLLMISDILSACFSRLTKSCFPGLDWCERMTIRASNSESSSTVFECLLILVSSRIRPVSGSMDELTSTLRSSTLPLILKSSMVRKLRFFRLSNFPSMVRNFRVRSTGRKRVVCKPFCLWFRYMSSEHGKVSNDRFYLNS